MHFDWQVYNYDYRNRKRNLDVSAQGVVKSNKFFPVFIENGKEVVFKPLSKTKPLSTPYFSYSEVFWSTIINKYFDPKTPIYKLAICKNIEDDFENKHHHGTIVDSIVNNGEKLVNLYEVFRDNPDPSVDISKYINYCEQFYDYRSIFNSRLIKENNEFANDLAMQILISMLKLDQNYHYENVLFKVKKDSLKEVAPMIDHEFSTMFLYPDRLDKNNVRFIEAIHSLTDTKDACSDIVNLIRYEKYAVLSKNLDIIVPRYPQVAEMFIEKLKAFIEDLKQQSLILEDNGFITPFNSDDYKIGHALFKDNNPIKAEDLRLKIKRYSPDINTISDVVYKEVLETSQALEKSIENRLVKKYI